MRSRLRRPSPALLVAALALFVALGGPAEASRLINGKLIRKGTVRSKQIKNHSLARADFSRSAVKSLRYTPKNSITPSKIRRNAVGSSELRSSSVSSMNVIDNSLLSQDLATGSVGADEIIDGTIGSNDLGSNIVSAGKLKSGAVRASEVADGTLRAVDLGSFAGTVSGVVPPLGKPGSPTACTTLPSGSLSALSGNQDMRDDLVLVGRPANLPATLAVAGQPDGANTNVIDVIVCNRSDDAAYTGGTFSFPFLTINP